MAIAVEAVPASPRQGEGIKKSRFVAGNARIAILPSATAADLGGFVRGAAKPGTGLSGISCGVGHDGSKGAQPCQDAKSLSFRTPFCQSRRALPSRPRQTAQRTSLTAPGVMPLLPPPSARLLGALRLSQKLNSDRNNLAVSIAVEPARMLVREKKMTLPSGADGCPPTCLHGTKSRGMDMKAPEAFHIYCVANDAAKLARDLCSSPDIAAYGIPLSVLWNETSAAGAYAREMSHADAEFLIFVHQDVYLPRGWFDNLEREFQRLSEIDPEWAVAGLAGVRIDGSYVFHIWDSGLGVVCGRPLDNPVAVASLDELLLIVRRSANVCFDPELPRFHLYGTDIVLTAYSRGKSAYVLDVPALHNCEPGRRLGRDYVEAYEFMVKKWHSQLPWPTLIHPLTNNRWSLMHRRLRVRYKAIFRASTLFSPLPDPAAKARELGFETTRPAAS